MLKLKVPPNECFCKSIDEFIQHCFNLEENKPKHIICIDIEKSVLFFQQYRELFRENNSILSINFNQSQNIVTLCCSCLLCEETKEWLKTLRNRNGKRKNWFL